MKRKKTDDNSHTIYSEQFKEHYHSTHGAKSESLHIFINAGLQHLLLKSINILEVGFGTGLNALLTFDEAEKSNLTINYTAIEKFPVAIDLIKELNYGNIIGNKYNEIFSQLHTCSWEKEIPIRSHFSITKKLIDLKNYSPPKNYFNLIYFDAFSPETQPELWSQGIFAKLFASLKTGGILTTYSSKGIVKNNLRNAGFTVKRLPGPKGKRHILRAIRE